MLWSTFVALFAVADAVTVVAVVAVFPGQIFAARSPS